MSLTAMSRQVDTLFESYTRPGSPGCVIGVLRDGAILYKQGYGLANVEHDVPNTPATLFSIGSESKQFTAMAILLLMAAGRLSLDDDIRAHLPEAPDFGHVVTIRHLLHHTSGVRCSFPPLLMLGGWMEGDITTNDNVFRLFLAQRDLNFEPGAEYSYANMGYIVLARIVERLTEKPFAEFCLNHIFAPLDMKQTVIQDNPWLLVPGRAQSYWMDEGEHCFNAYLPDGVAGPTNVYSSVEELALWDENFYSGRVGGHALIQEMMRPGRLNDGTELNYAAGLALGPEHRHRGLALVEHGGGHGGYVSAIVRFPERHFSVIFLSNVFHWQARQYALQVADIYLDGLFNHKTPVPERDADIPVPAALAQSESFEQMAGLYFNRQRVALREVSLSGGALQLFGFNLLPVEENAFVIEGAPEDRLLFSIDSAGAYTRMRIRTLTTDYAYERVVPVTPGPAELAEYAGLYFSPELNVHWRIVLEGDHLNVKHPRYPESTLMPVFADGFKDDWSHIAGYPVRYFILFERDEAGGITGFGISDDRMRNLQFQRLAG